MRSKPDYENIRRLEQELGIGWMEWPGVGYVRDNILFELPDGRIVPIKEAFAVKEDPS